MELASAAGIRNCVFPGKSEGVANLLTGRMCPQPTHVHVTGLIHSDQSAPGKVQTGHFFTMPSIPLPCADNNNLACPSFSFKEEMFQG